MSLIRMVQTFELVVFSPMMAFILSPAWMVIDEMVMAGAGISSYQAEYDACPDSATSCSVPVWIRVESVIVHPASTHPPPMPIHVDEYSASPGLCGVAVGTIQDPDTTWNIFPPCSSEPWLYTDQLLDWFG